MRCAHPAALAFTLLVLLPAVSPAGPQDDDPDSLAAGVVARFSADAAPGVEAVRVSTTLSWDWSGGSPDLRLPARGLRLAANGSLLIQAPGAYRFFVRGEGASGVLKVGDTVASEGKEGRWSGMPIDLRAGYVTLRLEATPTAPNLAVDWEGPSFPREAVPARLLYHDPASTRPADRFEEGRRLADRLGCAGCHALGLPAHNELGPPLPDVVRGADHRWVTAWLKDPGSVRPRSRMPAFGRGLGPADAADLASYLARLAARVKPATAEVRMALNVASPEKGRLLFRSIGCLGCHGAGEAGDKGPPVAPDLAGIGRTRRPEDLAAYLEHTKGNKATSRHRPDLRLTADDSAHIAAFLTDDTEPFKAAEPVPAGDPKRGEALSLKLRCAACHSLPDHRDRTPVLRLARLRPGSGCLANEPAPDKPDVPHYTLSADDREALRAFVSGLPASASPESTETRAHDAIRRLNCLGCHARDARGGHDLAGRLAQLLAQDAALGSLKGTLTPPNLTAVGDKLRPDYLALAIHGEAPTARPWLSVRMPAFTFEPGEAEAIATTFRAHDQIGPPDDPASPQRAARMVPAERDVAARLIGQRGFGCLSCHVLSGRIPPGGEPETLGPDLALVHRRMTAAYFRHWIADPQRIIAGTPMPQFLKPIEGAPGSLDDQLNTVWRLLGSESLAEVAATGTREVLKREGSRAQVVRDMVLDPSLPDTPYTPRGLAVGFKNGVSLLFDTDRLGWLSAWRGGFLSRTKSGRLWEWHPEGSTLWTAGRRLPPVVLVAADGSVRLPVEERERFGTFSELDFQGDGVRLKYRLRFEDAPSLDVAEDVQPVESGWSRRVRVETEPDGLTACLVEQLPQTATSNERRDRYTWTVGPDRITLIVPADGSGRGPGLPGVSTAVWVPCESSRRGGDRGIKYVIEPAR